MSPKEVLLLLTVGYGSPQWFVPPVIINFLLIREYLYVFEWQWIGSCFPLIPFSLTPRFPGHSSKDVRKSTLARWRECWNTRKVRVGCVCITVSPPDDGSFRPHNIMIVWPLALWHSPVKHHCFPVAHSLASSSYLAIFSHAKSWWS